MAALRPWRAIQLVHPYPSGLNAALTAVLVLLAGGTLGRAILLGGSMLLLQFAIGAANDWADATADAVGRPAKPIVSGLVAREQVRTVAAVCAVGGLTLATLAGPPVAAVALAGLADGLAYDLGLKGSTWAWLPFSAGFALLPLFAWLGGAGVPPPFFPSIALLALPAGAAVALANGLVDLEGDERVGRRGPAVRLGRRGTIRALFVLQVLLVAGVAVALLWHARATPAVWAGVAAGGGLMGIGRLVAGGLERERRLLGWEIQALGLAALAGAWFAGMIG